MSGALTWWLGRSATTSGSPTKRQHSAWQSEAGLTVASAVFVVAFTLLLAFGLTELRGYLVRVYGWQPITATLVIAAGLVGEILLMMTVNTNVFSLHAMYRDQLIRAYLGASRTGRRENRFTHFDPYDNLPLAYLSTPFFSASDWPEVHAIASRLDTADERAEVDEIDADLIAATASVRTMDRAATEPLIERWNDLLSRLGNPAKCRGRWDAMLQPAYAGVPSGLRGSSAALEDGKSFSSRQVDGAASHRTRPPLHIINTALNLVSGEDLDWQERKAALFTMTALHAGSPVTRYRPMLDDEGRFYGGTTGVSLGTAMAISGAAANPSMGYHSSPLVTFLLTLLNGRLGAWIGNPHNDDTFSHGYPRGFRLIPMPLLEAFGQTTSRGKYVNLSDGGHVENLGLYELVRRRCSYIVAIDAGADEDYAFEDLGNAVRKIRVDLGIDIDIKGFRIQEPQPTKYIARGSINYPEGEPGKLLYVKPVLCDRDEPIDVKQYGKWHQKYPQESTVDQWFSESQFESYRALGFGPHVAVGQRAGWRRQSGRQRRHLVAQPVAGGQRLGRQLGAEPGAHGGPGVPVGGAQRLQEADLVHRPQPRLSIEPGLVPECRMVGGQRRDHDRGVLGRAPPHLVDRRRVRHVLEHQHEVVARLVVAHVPAADGEGRGRREVAVEQRLVAVHPQTGGDGPAAGAGGRLLEHDGRGSVAVAPRQPHTAQRAQQAHARAQRARLRPGDRPRPSVPGRDRSRQPHSGERSLRPLRTDRPSVDPMYRHRKCLPASLGPEDCDRRTWGRQGRRGAGCGARHVTDREDCLSSGVPASLGGEEAGLFEADSSRPRTAARRALAASLPAHMVRRPRLVEALEARSGRLVVVTGPAGSGKTVAVRDWLSTVSGPTAWLSLQARHTDPERFLEDLVATVDDLAPGLQDALGREDPADHSAGWTMARAIDHLATAPPATLVLDDLHVIDRSPTDRPVRLPRRVRESSKLTVVICSRSDPPLPLHRFRLAGELVELRQADLRFDRAEAEEFFARFPAGRPEPGPDRPARRPHRGVGGGAAVRRPVPASGATTPTRSSTASPAATATSPTSCSTRCSTASRHDVRDFLLADVGAGALAADLCAHVTGRADAAASCCGGSRPSTCSSSRSTTSGSGSATTTCSASCCGASCGSRGPTSSAEPRAGRRVVPRPRPPDLAIDHLLDAERYGEAFDLLTAHLHDHLAAGRHETVRGWLARFPADVRRRHAGPPAH